MSILYQLSSVQHDFDLPILLKILFSRIKLECDVNIIQLTENGSFSALLIPFTSVCAHRATYRLNYV